MALVRVVHTPTAHPIALSKGYAHLIPKGC